MAINFPANPAVNDLYTYGGRTWICTVAGTPGPAAWASYPGPNSIAINSTQILGGSTGSILYDNAGSIGELPSPLPIANGGTNATSFTNTYVTYFNGTSLTGNSGLTYNGTTFVAAKDIYVNGMIFGLGGGQNSTNVAIGASALPANTTGAQNFAIGTYSLLSNQTGNNNVAIGTQALSNNVSGSNNTSIGRASLQNTLSGSNVAIGYFCLNSNTTGDSNVSVGTQSSQNNTIGYANVGLGNSTLYNNIVGAFNSAVGHSALSNTTGSNNTAIGGLSGSGIYGGSNNSILGAYSGATAPISNSGSNYVVLSDGAGNVRSFADGNGNNVMGTGALATNATNGFLYIPACAGTPTGTPTTYTGRVPLVVDSTNNKMYIYSGGAWVALN